MRGRGRRDGCDSLPVAPLVPCRQDQGVDDRHVDAHRLGHPRIRVHSQRDGRDGLPVVLVLPRGWDSIVWGCG